MTTTTIDEIGSDGKKNISKNRKEKGEVKMTEEKSNSQTTERIIANEKNWSKFSSIATVMGFSMTIGMGLIYIGTLINQVEVIKDTTATIQNDLKLVNTDI